MKSQSLLTKLLRAFLALALVVTAAFSTAGSAAAIGSTTLATATASPVHVDGTVVSFQAYTISGYNYFKLRDLAQVLNGTGKSFNVTWVQSSGTIRVTTGTDYVPVGKELTNTGSSYKAAATESTSTVTIDGKNVSFTAYLIDGYTYFKLRDIGKALNFGVTYQASSGKIFVDSTVGYTEPVTVAEGYDVGKAMPDFTMNLLGGGSFTLSQHRGKPVFINVFATWCGPCVREMPDIQKLTETYGSTVDFIIIDAGFDSTDEVKDFLSSYGYTFPTAISADGKLGSYDVEFIPQTFILNADGVIDYYHPGSSDYNTFSSELSSLLGT